MTPPLARAAVTDVALYWPGAPRSIRSSLVRPFGIRTGCVLATTASGDPMV